MADGDGGWEERGAILKMFAQHLLGSFYQTVFFEEVRLAIPVMIVIRHSSVASV